jgi:hypothetical protein
MDNQWFTFPDHIDRYLIGSYTKTGSPVIIADFNPPIGLINIKGDDDISEIDRMDNIHLAVMAPDLKQSIESIIEYCDNELGEWRDVEYPFIPNYLQAVARIRNKAKVELEGCEYRGPNQILIKQNQS